MTRCPDCGLRRLHLAGCSKAHVRRPRLIPMRGWKPWKHVLGTPVTPAQFAAVDQQVNA